MNKIISNNTLWKAHSTQNGNKLLVAKGATLTIEEGVTVEFNEITLQGHIKCK